MEKFTITLDSDEMQTLKEALVLLYDERRGKAGEAKLVFKMLEKAESKATSGEDEESALRSRNIEMVNELDLDNLRALYLELVRCKK